MEKKPLWYRWDDHDLLIQVRVQPRASRDEFAEVQALANLVIYL